MKNVSFVSNTSDGMRCVPAVFKMLYKYFLDEDLSWEDLDKLMKVIPGKGVWTFTALTDLAKRGVKIKHIEPVDYQKLFDQGVDYLYEVVGRETADYYINKSNIASIISEIPEFMKQVKVDIRKADIDEVISALKENKIVSMEIDACRLNDTKGFSLHYVLAFGLEDDHVVLHDPGLPATESRRVSIEKLNQAFSFEGAGQSINIYG